MSAEPLVIEFEVAVSPARAFSVWTERCGTWWPRSHTVSGDPAAITFEPRAGGRIFERADDDQEHDWGRVLDWEPPSRLRYRWHLFFDPSEATEVEVTFTAVAPPSPAAGADADDTRADAARRTAVRLEQRGWERLGDAGAERRARTYGAWARITAAFIAAAEG